MIIMGRNLLSTWNSKLEYMRFKTFLRVVERMQSIYRQKLFKRKLAESRNAIKAIARAHKMYHVKKVLYGAKKLIVTLSHCRTKLMFRAFMARVRINKRIVNDVFDIAWIEIENKMKGGASKTV